MKMQHLHAKRVFQVCQPICSDLPLTAVSRTIRLLLETVALTSSTSQHRAYKSVTGTGSRPRLDPCLCSVSFLIVNTPSAVGQAFVSSLFTDKHDTWNRTNHRSQPHIACASSQGCFQTRCSPPPDSYCPVITYHSSRPDRSYCTGKCSNSWCLRRRFCLPGSRHSQFQAL